MKRLRASLEIDQQAMAIKLGTSQRTLSDWENGYAGPNATQRVHFLYVLHDIAPTWTEEFATIFGIATHPAVEPLLQEDEPEDAPTVVAAPPALPPAVPVEPAPVAVEAAPKTAGTVPPQETPRPSPEETRAAIDAVVHDAADGLDLRASELRKGAHAVLTAIKDTGVTIEEALAALAASEVRRKRRA